MTRDEVLQEGKRSPTWLRLIAADYRFEYANIFPAQDSLELPEFEGATCDLLSYLPVETIKAKRCAPRPKVAKQWLKGTLMGTMRRRNFYSVKVAIRFGMVQQSAC